MMDLEQRRLIVMSEYKAKGAWHPAARTVVKCIMGSASIDLREAVFDHPEVVFDVSSIMGEVKFIVPPWVRVESDGMAIMGQFEHHYSSTDDPAAPVVRIIGSAMMGSVVVKTRLPGESALEAWRRQIKSLRVSSGKPRIDG